MYAQCRYDRNMCIVHHAVINTEHAGEVAQVIILSVTLVSTMKTAGTHSIQFCSVVLQFSYFFTFEDNTQ